MSSTPYAEGARRKKPSSDDINAAPALAHMVADIIIALACCRCHKDNPEIVGHSEWLAEQQLAAFDVIELGQVGQPSETVHPGNQ